MRPTTSPQGQVGPPEPILAPNLIGHKNGQKGLMKQVLAISNHQRPPAQVQQAFASIKGKDSPSSMYSVQRIQAWCIYGIIFHYAPILLSNLMVMFSGPNHAIPIQVPKSITHFEGSIFSHSVLQSLAATRRPFEDPNHLALQELGHIFFSGLFQGKFKEVINYSISFKASST
ncbi:hypothetical protein O181_069820 [Austropuccinia psidii MF-1]|uniref:Uncharacterized protein n=1 Tax=Austropuccinia psidii MF-1 TaxID=1389203 RepID=A0A9Q3F3M7_9BASI|nr:hypothetical protein [Austropuccinia psidii MF-1]